MITANELMSKVDIERKKSGMSQTEYAAFLGVSKSYYSRLLSGKRRPSIEVCKILKNKLPDLRSIIDNYSIGLTETDAHKTPNQALRGQNNGIDKGGDR